MVYVKVLPFSRILFSQNSLFGFPMCIINLIICFSAVPLMSSASSSPRAIKQPPETPEMDEQNNKKWQEEISTGFDRLVAYATEVDKRRKSCDSKGPGNYG